MYQKICTKMSIASSFTTAKAGNHLCPPTVKWIVYITEWNLYGDENKCGNIIDSLKHVEWEKSQTPSKTMLFHLYRAQNLAKLV